MASHLKRVHAKAKQIRVFFAIDKSYVDEFLQQLSSRGRVVKATD